MSSFIRGSKGARRIPKSLAVPRAAAPLLKRIGAMAAQQGVAVYAVGGCVRDWLLGHAHVLDVDVAVEGDAIAFARAVQHAVGGDLIVHAQFGTATVTMPARRRQPEQRLDFAMCRTERYARPAAYPKVAQGTITTDLFRRDFTVNAMAVALTPGRFGTLVDPYGGAHDLLRRRLRILHAKSFLDDPSRILRGIRFAQRFGLRWEPLTAQACRTAVAQGALSWLNAGRIERELSRMAEEPDPRACLQALVRLMAGKA